MSCVRCRGSKELLKSSKARLKGNKDAGLDKIEDLVPQ